MKTYKRTDKEIIDAMNYIKSQFNGELPYQFGTFECAKIMAAYVDKLASDGDLADVSERNWSADEIIERLDSFKNIEAAPSWFNTYGR